ncbi:hypothetical protein AB9T88_02680 [Flavobacterium sp. LBUM151]
MKKLKFIIASLLIMLLSCDTSHDENDDKKSYDNQKINICTFDLVNSVIDSASVSKPNAAIINWPRWQTGQTIKIKFLDGDVAAQEKVKRIAYAWTVYANLKFEYVAKEDYADIRIGFNIGNPGAWSELGMRSAYGSDLNRQTMRLGPLTADEGSIRRTILHEFGHALGLIHENLSPASKINWNLPKVYKYYNDLMGWSKEDVDRFVIKSPEQTNYSEYDPLSIMHYYIDPSLTTDGVRVPEQNELSKIDIVSINKWYPFAVTSIIEPKERIDVITWTKGIKSSNGRYSLQFNSGNLFILDSINNQKIWSVGNAVDKNASCTLQSNGEIIIMGSNPGVFLLGYIWRSKVSGVSGGKLYLQDDGNLELIQNGVVKWSSKTGKI